MKRVCRLAPSPTGRMHAGNIFSSLVSWLIARSSRGEVVLRIEDLDEQRSKREYVDQVQRDYELLGLTWDRGPYFQASNSEAYRNAYETLENTGLVYPCFCSRADLHASSAPNGAFSGIYAGTCRHLTQSQQEARFAELRKAGKCGPAYRIRVWDGKTEFTDLIYGLRTYDMLSDSGDFIVRRADGMFAYQLAVVVDDSDQGINTVVRGNDLLSSSCRQRFIQDCLGLDHVEYAHVPLLVAPDGRRLAKRDKDAHLDTLLDRYRTPEAVLGAIAYVTGIIDRPNPASADELLASFSLETCRKQWSSLEGITWSCAKD